MALDVRGPCAVRAKRCKGAVPSCNNDHEWNWRTAQIAGSLTAANVKEIDGIETSWAAGDDVWVCDSCKRLACHKPVHKAREAKKAERAAEKAAAASGGGRSASAAPSTSAPKAAPRKAAGPSAAPSAATSAAAPPAAPATARHTRYYDDRAVELLDVHSLAGIRLYQPTEGINSRREVSEADYDPCFLVHGKFADDTVAGRRSRRPDFNDTCWVAARIGLAYLSFLSAAPPLDVRRCPLLASP